MQLVIGTLAQTSLSDRSEIYKDMKGHFLLYFCLVSRVKRNCRPKSRQLKGQLFLQSVTPKLESKKRIKIGSLQYTRQSASSRIEVYNNQLPQDDVSVGEQKRNVILSPNHAQRKTFIW